MAGPRLDRVWPYARGAFHDVLVTEAVVARLSRHPGHERRVGREWATTAAVACAVVGVPVPHVRSGVMEAFGRSGFLVERCSGRTRLDPYEAALSRLVVLLAHFQSTPPVGLALPHVREWAGGPRWSAVVEHDLVPLVGTWGGTARRVVDAVLTAESGVGRRVLVHGDFGMHNVLWVDAAVTGLVDLDCCSIGDPAIDVAPLVGQFGARALLDHLPADEVRRAMIHRSSLSLQVASAATLVGDDALRDHALSNFVTRAAFGTLSDPTGLDPDAI